MEKKNLIKAALEGSLDAFIDLTLESSLHRKSFILRKAYTYFIIRKFESEIYKIPKQTELRQYLILKAFHKKIFV